MKDIRRSARKIITDPQETSAHDCDRGLERSGDRRRRQQIDNKIFMILQLQEENRRAGVALHAGLSALSQSLSRADVRCSLKLARQDASCNSLTLLTTY